jgi:hypothetical protein
MGTFEESNAFCAYWKTRSIEVPPYCSFSTVSYFLLLFTLNFARTMVNKCTKCFNIIFCSFPTMHI